MWLRQRKQRPGEIDGTETVVVGSDMMQGAAEDEEEEVTAASPGGEVPVTKHGVAGQRWRVEEDVILRAYVKQYGPKEWNLVSQHMKVALNRDAKSFLERWKNYLRLGIKKDSLTEEQQLLVRISQEEVKKLERDPSGLGCTSQDAPARMCIVHPSSYKPDVANLDRSDLSLPSLFQRYSSTIVVALFLSCEDSLATSATFLYCCLPTLDSTTTNSNHCRRRSYSLPVLLSSSSSAWHCHLPLLPLVAALDCPHLRLAAQPPSLSPLPLIQPSSTIVVTPCHRPQHTKPFFFPTFTAAIVITIASVHVPLCVKRCLIFAHDLERRGIKSGH
ncbi:hypothetical protein BHE74_00045399, partial [Ensete ventricosum]